MTCVKRRAAAPAQTERIGGDPAAAPEKGFEMSAEHGGTRHPTRPEIQSILLHLDGDPLCAARTQAALQLARQFDAHVIGLAPTGAVDLPATISSASSLAEFAARAWESLHERAELTTRRFREDCAAAHVGSFEPLVDDADTAESLLRQAHGSDITVLSQPDPDATSPRARQAVIEQVILYSARPTLIVPYAGHFAHMGQRVMVAWDDSREAARAVADALPLLRRAQSVHVVQWSEGGESDEPPQARLERLRHWLLRHGVQASLRTENSHVDIANAILSVAADLDADLLVMGAYGHARWAELMLGGATRGVLKAMTLPVLMSH